MLLMLRSYILYMYFNWVKYDFIKLVCTFILPFQSCILKEAPMRISQVNTKFRNVHQDNEKLGNT